MSDKRLVKHEGVWPFSKLEIVVTLEHLERSARVLSQDVLFISGW